MGPVPDDNHNNNPDDNDPTKDPEELESPNHIIPPGDDSSSDDDNDLDSDMEGPANDGYMLLPQDPEEEGGGDTFQPQPFPPLSALEGDMLPAESMTEVRGAGIDVSQAVAQGSVHPAFAANFPDNKVPVHLQVPDQPKTKKDDVLWNQAPAEADERLQLDSSHLSKVKSAMAGFQLPKANIPDWAKQIPEEQWKRQLVDRLTSLTLQPVQRPLPVTASSKVLQQMLLVVENLKNKTVSGLELVALSAMNISCGGISWWQEPDKWDTSCLSWVILEHHSNEHSGL